MNYKPQGVCSQLITVELNGDKIKFVEFFGGCDGNLKALSKLVVGMTVAEAIEKLRGITCGYKQTSCSDQLTYALEKALEESK